MRSRKRPAARRPVLGDLGRRVREARAARGWSVGRLAASSGVSVRFLHEIEAGRGNVSVARLAQIASALGMGLAQLVTDGGEPPRASRRIVALLGLRGAGKSTIGPRLASRLGLPFFELDGLIEAAAGLSVSEIFALHGEGYYRRLELHTLRRFLDRTPAAVLAAGGGIVNSAEAFLLLTRRSRLVWLKAKPEDHWERVVRQGDERPMRNNPQAMAELRALLREREPLYARAEIAVDTSEMGVRGSVDALVSRLSGGNLG